MSEGFVRRSGESEAREVTAGTATTMEVLVGPTEGAPNFALRRFRMEEGGGMPRHVNRVEHEQYVLSGRAKVAIGDVEHEVATGDALYIPAGVPHSYRVVEAPFEFLCVVPNAADRIEILERE
ncbi:MAG TPA: cupin domain-containing protein [Gemmatimonadota bacterium]|nr:cupin domain-containing protein [Gemmatimonadota bacterium]